MYKNFSPGALGITGRQSELIELALTYGFRGFDIDMADMRRRSSRSTPDEAYKYLRATDLQIGGFDLDIDLDADDDVYKTQLAALHPTADLAVQWKASHAFIDVPAATDRAAYPEYFEVMRARLTQIAEVLGARKLRLGIGFDGTRGATEGKEFPFITNPEGLIALVKALPAENVGLIIDSFHWLVAGGTLDQVAAVSPEKIVTVRLGSLGQGVAAAEATDADRVLPVLEGPLSHVAIVLKLKGIGYEGPIGPSASGLQYKDETREFIVSSGQEIIDAILTQAGIAVPPRPCELVSQYPDEPVVV
ncbi:MAG: sugar phosphate isomerase/epimerase [Planctomycetaceae bacterium]|nr:MAG: sugar phosphate isomerase/epimerase [Planctomycetaceae bacterium]